MSPETLNFYCSISLTILITGTSTWLIASYLLGKLKKELTLSKRPATVSIDTACSIETIYTKLYGLVYAIRIHKLNCTVQLCLGQKSEGFHYLDETLHLIEKSAKISVTIRENTIIITVTKPDEEGRKNPKVFLLKKMSDGTLIELP